MAEQHKQEINERTVKLVSIVAIDVVGFSSMSEKDHKKAARHIENLRDRIERTAYAHGGRVFNTAGDGFMLEFNSAGQALGAIQEILDRRKRSEPQIRVGAHVGDVVVTANDDLLGHGVNVAARLQALAKPGSALVSSEFRSMAHSSPTASFLARGRQPLENIEQKVQTYEILSKGQRFAHASRRFMYGAVGMAVIGGLLYFSPFILRTVQERMPSQASASSTEPAAPAATPAPSTFQQATQAAPPPPEAGQAIKDCANCPDMIVVPGGTFTMGSPARESGRAANEGPQREVAIPMFAVSKYEVTFAQWDACVAAGGCDSFSPADHGWGRGQRPVIGVSWNDAQKYVEWLNQQAGAPRYRLMTEAEWEYVARAGATTAYATGASLTAQQATFRVQQTTEVGAHGENAFHLFDLAGNAGEWVSDCYAADYRGAPVDGAAVDTANCRNRVARGGAYADRAPALRAAARKSVAADSRTAGLGFRVARILN